MNAQHTIPTEDDLRSVLNDRSNWGRWGRDDQLGAINMITSAKRLEAAQLVRDGRIVSLSRAIVPSAEGGPHDPTCEVSTVEPGGDGGVAIDHVGIACHGFGITHLDSLGHVWRDGRMWNDREADQEVTPQGIHWGDVDQWRDGIVTRAVLADIPELRGTKYVSREHPVHGHEIVEALERQGLNLRPGDALLVRSGRDAWDEENEPWHSLGTPGKPFDVDNVRPGLHASCLEVLRDYDVSVLLWDMLDLTPSGYRQTWSVHHAISAFGMAFVDNADFAALRRTCQELDRREFMLTVAPLRIIGGTGCPVNPIAMF